MPRKALPDKAKSAPRVHHGPLPAPAASKAGLTAPPHPTTLAGMTPPEPSLFAVIVEYVIRAGLIVAAAGIWYFGIGMKRSNDRRAEDAADDRKVTQAMLAALTELIRRTSPPSSQDGPRPGPAE